MLFPKLFNHGNLRSVKVEEGKVTFEGVYGKETFEGGSGDVHGIPSGGTSGQVLSKSSATDYDAGWSDVNQVPSDGTQNQVLTKGADGYGWSDVNAVPSDGTQGQVLTKGASGYGWETPQAGGGNHKPTISLRLYKPSGATFDLNDLKTSGYHTFANIGGELSTDADLSDYLTTSLIDETKNLVCNVVVSIGSTFVTGIANVIFGVTSAEATSTHIYCYGTIIIPETNNINSCDFSFSAQATKSDLNNWNPSNSVITGTLNATTLTLPT